MFVCTSLLARKTRMKKNFFNVKKTEVGNWSGRLVSQGEVIGTSLVEYNSEFDVYLCFTQRAMWSLWGPVLILWRPRGGDLLHTNGQVVLHISLTRDA